MIDGFPSTNEYKRQMIIQYKYQEYESLVAMYQKQFNLACKIYFLFKLDSMEQQLFYPHFDVQKVILGFLVALEQNDFLENYLANKKTTHYW